MPSRPESRSFEARAAAWRSEFPDADLDAFLLGAMLVRLGQIAGRDLADRSKRQFGSSGAELGLLFALRRQGAPYTARPRTLTRALLITSGAVTKQIDRLEAKGLVSRSADTASLNGQLITLTDAGFDLTERAVRHLADHSIVAEATQADPEALAEGLHFARALLDRIER